MRLSVVYVHKNKSNGKCYVGQTKQKIENRWKKNGSGYLDIVDGKYKNPKFAPAILKYGWDGFEHIVLHENITLTEANKLEKKLITSYDSLDNGYNCTEGGEGTPSVKRSLEWCKMKSKSMKGKLKGSANGCSRKIKCIETEDIFDSLSEACDAYDIKYSTFHTNLNKAIRNGHRCGGYHWEYLEPLQRPKIKMKKGNNTKKVKCIETGEIFKSVNEAAKKHNIHPSSISDNVKRGWKYGGVSWEYIK